MNQRSNDNMMKYNVAVVGATGLVGRKMVQVLEERNFPIKNLRLLASKKSVGKTIKFRSKDIQVEELCADSFKDINIALFSAGGTISKEYAPIAVNSGTIVIDNSSAWRMEQNVPLVVPEVNPQDIFKHRGIIANPNCSTIQLVVVLKPLHDIFKIKRVIVSTYQGVTGAGKKALDQLEGEILNNQETEKKFPHPIAYNVIPQVDSFTESGYTKEELKMVNETKKIMGDNSIQITATCVRVPVIGGHSESVNIEFERTFKIEEVFNILMKAPGVKVQDDITKSIYPMPILSHEKDDVYVGRIRRDNTVPSGLNLWIVSDNLRKGAATNAVQIAEELIRGK
jgi:aspartate-semialdehyde dehydrogenase